jgi:predicted RNA-binding Zn-ribbon protein involved in translation (DUF1610 family)
MSTINSDTDARLICPRCGEEVWDRSTPDQRLNKCWNCGLRFDNEEEEEDDDE